MKTKTILFITLPLATLLLVLLIDFMSKGGSATSTCSSQFVSCKAICAETHVYATSRCIGDEFFPICECAGLLKEQSYLISANEIQTENLEEFIKFVSNLEIVHKENIVDNLKKVKNAIQVDDYETYHLAVYAFSEITGTLSDEDVRQLRENFSEKPRSDKY